MTCATCLPGHGDNRVQGATKKKGGNKGIAQARRDERRREAETRQFVRDSILDEAQLIALHYRPGDSRRERERLERRLDS